MTELNKELLMSDIKKLGYSINSIDELKKIDKSNKDVIPIVLKHLSKITDESDKEFLVRCLGVKGYNEATEPLLIEYKNSSNNLYKWSIGNTLSLIMDQNSFEDLLEIASEKKHGIARQMIVDALGKFKDKRAIPVLVNLLEDENVQGHAILALAKFNDPSLIPYFEPFVNHEVTWIRNSAKKITAKLQKLSKTGEKSN